MRLRRLTPLRGLQQRTADPFLERRNVDAFVGEQLANRDLAYRRNPLFRWSYLG